MAKKKIVSLAVVAFVVNLQIFAFYRFIFIRNFVPGISSGEFVRVLLSGFRLDLALLGFEFCATAFCVLLCRRIKIRTIFLWFWFLTSVHAFVCIGNFFAVSERNQNAGELLLPYITSPYQVYLTLLPFCENHWALMVALAVILTIFCIAGFFFGRKLNSEPIDFWENKKNIFGLLGICAISFLFTLQPVVLKRPLALMGVKLRVGNLALRWKLEISKSKYFTTYSRYALNQAVLNPLFEFVQLQIPARIRNNVRYHLSEEESLAVWREESGRTAKDPQHPLLMTIRGQTNSQIQNVILLQIEGFSQAVLEQERNGRFAMPFVRKLAKEGLYFPNTFQCVDYTSGGVFSTVASLPKASYEQTYQRFTTYELGGHYGSLPHILGDHNYTHFSFEGFRQSSDDFIGFMSNQGYKAVGYFDFTKSLRRKNKLDAADTKLGIFDDYFFQEGADILLQCQTPFTAHFMTCSTHSPWEVPDSFSKPFDQRELNSFAYLDSSIQHFVERLEENPAVWDKTLLVIIADHTSVTFGETFLERFRIPLIFYSPHSVAPEIRPAIVASQLDVVPTIIALLPGEHKYSGLGKNLLDSALPATGVVSGTTQKGYYLKNDLVLEYTPANGEIQIGTLKNGNLESGEASEEIKKSLPLLRKEYFAQVELSKRLSLVDARAERR
jgi:phosphoglycerol transferase MdoB-like AlkP superfamily enzyme